MSDRVYGDAMAPASTGKTNVFISYSRADLDFADQIDATLRLAGFATTLDRNQIQAGEDWRQRLGALIRDADTMVFVLTSTSARSDICAWEVTEAHRLGKRIMPIVPHPIGDVAVPPGLAALNYIYFYAEPKRPGSGFGPGLIDLVEGLKTDLGWLREHTRLLQRASEWDAGGRPANRLLSGSDITAAKTWLGTRPRDAPPATDLHVDYIAASEAWEAEQANERARQLAERERLVRQAEQAQRRFQQLRWYLSAAVVIAMAVLSPYIWQAYYAIRFSVPLPQVTQRLAQYELWVKNFDCKFDYLAFQAATEQQSTGELGNTRLDIGVCPKTGDVSLRVAPPDGQPFYVWVPRDGGLGPSR